MKRLLSDCQYTLERGVAHVYGNFVGGTTSLGYDALVGPFTPTQQLTGGTSNATGTIDSDTNDDTQCTLLYDTQTGDFTVGQVVTGGTSGATGTIAADTDNGTDGVLRLTGVVGTFANNEAITDPITGAALVDGTNVAYAGTLVLSGVVGEFSNNENITDGVTGDATSDGTGTLGAPTVKGKGISSIVQGSTEGEITITFQDKWAGLLMFESCLIDSEGTIADWEVVVKSEAVATSKTIVLMCFKDGTARHPGTDQKVYFEAVLSQYSNPPAGF